MLCGILDVIILSCIVGDFHFLWECLKVGFAMLWGTPTTPGSLSCLREKIGRVQVDKSGKVFNVGDEFLVHCFKAHLIASVCTLLNLSSPSDTIQNEVSPEWLKATADSLVSKTLMPRTNFIFCTVTPSYWVPLCGPVKCNKVGEWASYYSPLVVVAP